MTNQPPPSGATGEPRTMTAAEAHDRALLEGLQHLHGHGDDCHACAIARTLERLTTAEGIVEGWRWRGVMCCYCGSHMGEYDALDGSDAQRQAVLDKMRAHDPGCPASPIVAELRALRARHQETRGLVRDLTATLEKRNAEVSRLRAGGEGGGAEKPRDPAEVFQNGFQDGVLWMTRRMGRTYPPEADLQIAAAAEFFLSYPESAARASDTPEGT